MGPRPDDPSADVPDPSADVPRGLRSEHRAVPSSVRRPPPSRSRVPAARAPLAGRVDVLERPAVRAAVRADAGRVRRFFRRHGWRAYAIPFLVVATVVALVDLVAREGEPAPAASSTAAPAPAVPSSGSSPQPSPTGALELAAPAEGDVGPTDAPAPALETTFVQQGAGSVSLVDGSSPVFGTGPLRRFVVEVEDGIGVDGATFAEAVSQTLSDPRSWGAGGRSSFQRVGVAEAAARQFDFRVTLVSPGSMERYCPGVGTGGYTSCRYGERAVINLARWATAVPHYEGDIATYRHYVVNHEVGHILGHGHVDCPGPGRLAPVMQQQTLSLQSCVRNPWPFP